MILSSADFINMLDIVKHAPFRLKYDRRFPDSNKTVKMVMLHDETYWFAVFELTI